MLICLTQLYEVSREREREREKEKRERERGDASKSEVPCQILKNTRHCKSRVRPPSFYFIYIYIGICVYTHIYIYMYIFKCVYMHRYTHIINDTIISDSQVKLLQF